jgi:hypothetical protein
MAKSTHVNMKAPTKRPTEKGDLVGVRIQKELGVKIDAWRRDQLDLPNRPEAIRRLVEVGLRARK